MLNWIVPHLEFGREVLMRPEISSVGAGVGGAHFVISTFKVVSSSIQRIHKKNVNWCARPRGRAIYASLTALGPDVNPCAAFKLRCQGRLRALVKRLVLFPFHFFWLRSCKVCQDFCFVLQHIDLRYPTGFSRSRHHKKGRNRCICIYSNFFARGLRKPSSELPIIPPHTPYDENYFTCLEGFMMQQKNNVLQTTRKVFCRGENEASFMRSIRID